MGSRPLGHPVSFGKLPCGFEEAWSCLTSKGTHVKANKKRWQAVMPCKCQCHLHNSIPSIHMEMREASHDREDSDGTVLVSPVCQKCQPLGCELHVPWPVTTASAHLRTPCGPQVTKLLRNTCDLTQILWSCVCLYFLVLRGPRQDPTSQELWERE